jgi:hypothetical protein
MNKPPPLLLSSAIIASSLTYAGCDIVKPPEDPNSLSAYVPIEKTPRHPEKTPATAAPQETGSAPGKANKPSAPALGISLMTRELINDCHDLTAFTDCDYQKQVLFQELQIQLPAQVAKTCADQSPGILCAERAFTDYLSPDPRLDFYSQVKSRCLAILADCQNGTEK